jgi:hypothetical protein
MLEIRFDKTKDEVALLIWFLFDHSVYLTLGDLFLSNFYFYYNFTKGMRILIISFCQYLTL